MRTAYIQALPPRWEKFSRVFSALGDPRRQRILLMFEQGERLTIKQIAEALPMSRTAVVHHIQVLLDAGVLRRSKSGKEVFLRIDKRLVTSSIERVSNFIQRNA